MAFPQAAKSVKIVCATGSSAGTTFQYLGLITEARLRHSADMIDVSVMSSSAWKDFIVGLKNVSMTFSGIYPGTSDAGFAIVRDSWLNDSALSIRYLFDGSTGFQSAAKVASFELGGTVDGRLEFSGEIQFTGSLGNATGTTS